MGDRNMNRKIIRLALCFDASINGERLPDVDGAQFLEQEAAVCFGQRH